MKKYLLIVILSILVILGIIWIFLYKDQTKEEKLKEENYEEITMVLPTSGFVPENIETVTDALNEISVSKCNVKVNFIFTNISDMTYVCRFRLKAGEQIDLMPCMENNNLLSYIKDGMLEPLDDLLAEEAPELEELFYPELWEAMHINGKIYALTALGSQSNWSGAYLREDVLEAAGINAEDILADYAASEGTIVERLDQTFTPILAAIHNSENVMEDGSSLSEKKLIPGNNDYQSIFSQFPVIEYEGFGNTFGVVIDSKPEIVNIYETEEYKEKIELLKSWNEAGYIYQKKRSVDDDMNVLFHGENALGIFTSLGVDVVDSQNAVAVNENLYLPLVNEKCAADKFRIGTWVIPSSSEHKEAAMKILKLMFTDEEYVRTYYYETNSSSESDVYDTGVRWMFGNTYLSTESYEQSKEDVTKYYSAIHYSPYLSFTYDDSKYEDIISALQEILDSYLPDLENGKVEDVDTKLQEMNEELYEAGLQKIIDDKQMQLDQWIQQTQ